MKILVVSDSHKKLNKLIEAYEKESPDAVICAGDHASDCYELSLVYPNNKYYIVSGNCDFFDRNFRQDIITNIGGYQFFITHGHSYQAKTTYSYLLEKGYSTNSDIVIFGHTHRQYSAKEGGLTLFNPGAILTDCYGVIEISEKDIDFYHKIL